MDKRLENIDLIALGGSAGSVRTLCQLLGLLEQPLRCPLVVCLHRSPKGDSSLADLFAHYAPMPVVEPKGGECPRNGRLYLAPPDYHLTLDEVGCFRLDHSPLVQYSRPSIDVMLYSAAEAYREKALGILVTGANQDGAVGMKMIQEHGGLTAIQDPAEALISYMPESVLEHIEPTYRWTIGEMARFFHKHFSDPNAAATQQGAANPENRWETARYQNRNRIAEQHMERQAAAIQNGGLQPHKKGS